MICSQCIWRILYDLVFINACVFLMVFVVVLQVSASYNRTVLMFALKIVTLVFSVGFFEFHMFFSCGNAVLTLTIRALATVSDPLCLSIMLPGT